MKRAMGALRCTCNGVEREGETEEEGSRPRCEEKRDLKEEEKRGQNEKHT